MDSQGWSVYFYSLKVANVLIIIILIFLLYVSNYHYEEPEGK